MSDHAPTDDHATADEARPEAAPAVPESPSGIDAPGVVPTDEAAPVEQTDASDESATTDVAPEVEPAGAAEEPTAAEDPVPAAEPVTVDEPVAADEPGSAEEPAPAEDPAATDEPGSAEEHVATEDPAAIDERGPAEEPAPAEDPAATDEAPVTAQVEAEEALQNEVEGGDALVPETPQAPETARAVAGSEDIASNALPAPAGTAHADEAVEPTLAAEPPLAAEPSDIEPAAPTEDAGTAPVPAAATPRPTPRPLPRPPLPGPRPAVPSASPAGSPSPTPPPPVPPALTAAESAEAARWGRVDDDGTVWVRDAAGERVVGQYPGAEPADALAFYVRRFADLHAKVLLFESRLTGTELPVKEIETTLEHLTAELVEPAVVGDLDGLRARLEALRGIAAERKAAAEAERAAAKQVALEARTAIVEAAEKIAGTSPDRIQWRPAGEELRTLLDQWKDAQRHGPRVDRGAEDALWKRFSHARSTFDRERRRFFSELEKTNASAKTEKVALVAEAEKLATSTEWSATTSAYRDLMARWKTAGRASRKDDDALWARFRAAQDQFFAARDASLKETDAEFAANLEIKLGLLAEVEKLVPVTDLAAARAALRDIQERWERAGKVPRADIQRVEGRLRAVELAVREAEQTQWRRSNPETRARAEGAAAQLLAAISGLEADLAAAQAAGDARRVAEAQSALDARRAWLEQVQRAASDAQG